MIEKATTRALMVAALLPVCLALGCEDVSGPGDRASVRILLTDAPSELIASANVWISRVYLVPRDDDESDEGFQDLFNDPENPKQYDLLELRNGITADLTGDVEIDPASYAQLRMIVDRAEVTLIDGVTFNDGTNQKTLFVPSGAQTGIKVQLFEPIDATAGTTTTLTVDFDVDRNFVILGNPDTPAGIMGIIFTPVLMEKDRVEG